MAKEAEGIFKLTTEELAVINRMLEELRAVEASGKKLDSKRWEEISKEIDSFEKNFQDRTGTKVNLDQISKEVAELNDLLGRLMPDELEDDLMNDPIWERIAHASKDETIQFEDRFQVTPEEINRIQSLSERLMQEFHTRHEGGILDIDFFCETFRVITDIEEGFQNRTKSATELEDIYPEAKHIKVLLNCLLPEDLLELESLITILKERAKTDQGYNKLVNYLEEQLKYARDPQHIEFMNKIKEIMSDESKFELMMARADQLARLQVDAEKKKKN